MATRGEGRFASCFEVWFKIPYTHMTEIASFSIYRARSTLNRVVYRYTSHITLTGPFKNGEKERLWELKNNKMLPQTNKSWTDDFRALTKIAYRPTLAGYSINPGFLIGHSM